jgi:hypothetical protein
MIGEETGLLERRAGDGAEAECERHLESRYSVLWEMYEGGDV